MRKAARLDRREWLRLSAAGGVAGLLTRPAGPAGLVAAAAAVDHLLLGIGDLDKGIAWIEKATGVRAVVGGSHPGVGTRNALLALGGKRYLEIIAPDPAQSAYNFNIDLRHLAEPHLITWAAGAKDIDAFAKRAVAAGFGIFGPRAGSRARPDGNVLAWRTAGVLQKLGMDGVEPIPFFIAWAAGSIHPAEDSPKGCELEDLTMEHPRSAAVAEALAKLGIRAEVRKGERARLTARLRTPKGVLTLT